jgi:hypothetical protein
MKVGDRSKSFTVQCPAGMKVLGGGVATFNDQIQIPSRLRPTTATAGQSPPRARTTS